MSNKIKVSVIGTGRWGKNIIRVLSELGVLDSFCDSHNDDSKNFELKYNTINKTWDEILADKNIDAVVIALPGALHASFAKQALLANKHVFIEKPFTTELNSAIDLVTLAKTQNKILMIGHILHYHNGFIKLKEIINSGEIGELRYIESTRLHMGPMRYEIGILWELLAHDVSMLLGVVNLVDNETKIQNITVNQQSFSETNNQKILNNADLLDINILFNQNIKTRLCSSWMHPTKQQKFWVAGTLGSVVFDDTKPWPEKLKLVKYDKDQNITEYNIVLKESEPLTQELNSFVQAIITNTSPITNAHEGLSVVRLLDQIENIYQNNNLAKNPEKYTDIIEVMGV